MVEMLFAAVSFLLGLVRAFVAPKCGVHRSCAVAELDLQSETAAILAHPSEDAAEPREFEYVSAPKTDHCRNELPTSTVTTCTFPVDRV